MQVDHRYIAVCGRLTNEILRGIGSLHDAETACSALTTIMANVAGHLDDAAWKEVVEIAATPCGTASCNCETRRTELFRALTVLRDDYKAKQKEGAEMVFVPFAPTPVKPNKPSLN